VAPLSLQIRRAGLDELPIQLGILEAARARLHARGIPQWAEGFPPEEMAQAIQEDEVYIAWQEGQAVGTLTLSWAPPAVWGDVPPDAGYLSRLALLPVASGKGLGAHLLDWAAARVRAAGRSYLRLDCFAGNAGLRLFYERAGFVCRGEVPEESWLVARDERRV
jgi:GNAT superfamily N-acetyltransferase